MRGSIVAIVGLISGFSNVLGRSSNRTKLESLVNPGIYCINMYKQVMWLRHVEPQQLRCFVELPCFQSADLLR